MMKFSSLLAFLLHLLLHLLLPLSPFFHLFSCFYLLSLQVLTDEKTDDKRSSGNEDIKVLQSLLPSSPSSFFLSPFASFILHPSF